MALSTDQLNEAMAVANKYIRDDIPNQFAKATALFDTLSKKPYLEFVSGGTKIQQPVEIAENKSQGFYDGALGQIDTSINQQLSFADFDLKYAYSTVQFTQQDYAQTNDSKEAVKSLIQAKVNGAKNAFTRKLAAAMFGSGSDENGNAFNGFGDVFAASGTAYGGITNTDLDDATTWLTEIDTSTTGITYANINELVRKLTARAGSQSTDRGGLAPDMMISNSYVQSKFLNSQQSNQRFIGQEDLKAGFAGCKFNNIDWYVDENAPGSSDSGVADNDLYILSTSAFKFCYKYGFEGKNSPFDMQAQLPSQAIKTTQSFIAGNLVCTARRYNGVFKGLQA